MSTGYDSAGLHLRADAREEVDDTAEANKAYGCLVDDWCILRDGHAGPCDEQRELYPDLAGTEFAR